MVRPLAGAAGALLIGLATGLGSLSGCVERRYTIRTDPPGALVIVNGEEIGPTPVSRSFIYYGDRKITPDAGWLQDPDGHPADRRPLVGQLS